MRHVLSIGFMAVLLSAAGPSGSAQLRNLSEHSHDCIDINQTSFTLHEKNSAEFHYASAWTHMTVNAHPDKKAIFVWHFKDGSKAYSRQGDIIGDMGRVTGYMVTDHSTDLEDVHRKKIQPMTSANYPVNLELWIGEIEDATGYAPETLVDRVCYDAKSIQPNEPHHFSGCQ